MEKKYDNSGSLFRNEKKTEANPSWADYQGSITIEGVEYWLSAWIKKGQSGKNFMSLSVKPKENQPPAVKPEPKYETPVFPESPTDDLPF